MSEEPREIIAGLDLSEFAVDSPESIISKNNEINEKIKDSYNMINEKNKEDNKRSETYDHMSDVTFGIRQNKKESQVENIINFNNIERTNNEKSENSKYKQRDLAMAKFLQRNFTGVKSIDEVIKILSSSKLNKNKIENSKAFDEIRKEEEKERFFIEKKSRERDNNDHFPNNFNERNYYNNRNFPSKSSIYNHDFYNRYENSQKVRGEMDSDSWKNRGSSQNKSKYKVSSYLTPSNDVNYNDVRDIKKEEISKSFSRSSYQPEEENLSIYGVHKGEHFEKLTNEDIDIKGPDIPKDKIDNFEDAFIHSTILKNLKNFGYEKPTTVQRVVIPLIQKTRDLMVLSQTGSGKTAAFIIPIGSEMMRLLKNSTNYVTPFALVLSSSRELAIQTKKEAKKILQNTNLRVGCIYGGVDYESQFEIALNSHLLVATPGRLCMLIKDGRVNLSQIKWLVIDEADRMLQESFLPQIEEIVDYSGGKKKENRQTILQSATFPLIIQQMGSDLLKNYLFVKIGKFNSNINQIFYKIDKIFEKVSKLENILKDLAPPKKAIIFLNTKRLTDCLSMSLCERLEIPMTSIHGDFNQRERESAMRVFRTGQARILMATSVVSRGIDIQEVEMIINFEMPKSVDEYIHRIGRTARCGNQGQAIGFFDLQKDQNLAKPLVDLLAESNQEIPIWLLYASKKTPKQPWEYERQKFNKLDARNYQEFEDRLSVYSWKNQNSNHKYEKPNYDNLQHFSEEWKDLSN